jgi:pimeloyl-ACP methyl ester carboxylesterase
LLRATPRRSPTSSSVTAGQTSRTGLVHRSKRSRLRCVVRTGLCLPRPTLGSCGEVDDPALAHSIAQWMQTSCSPEAYQACYAALETYRASPALARITAPTLVIHNRRNRWVPVQVGQRIATSISGARLVLLDDLVYATVASAIREFVDETTGVAQERGRARASVTGRYPTGSWPP